MNAENFTLQRYFDRIGFTQEARADIRTIAAMMQCQLYTVPFENLDVQSGKGVTLDPERIASKILEQGRGGYCYEVNGLFAMALEALGISYQFVAARPMFYPARRPKTHMAIVARVDNERWLCDLGFGSYGIRAPMRLDLAGVVVLQGCDTFRIMHSEGSEYVLQALVDGAWTSQYAFDLSEQEWIDFIPANHFNSTHPDTVFVQKLLVIRQNPAGRKILFGDTLTSIAYGQRTSRQIDPAECPGLLSEHFGLSGALPSLPTPSNR